jgi:hypothetical protein
MCLMLHMSSQSGFSLKTIALGTLSLAALRAKKKVLDKVNVDFPDLPTQHIL